EAMGLMLLLGMGSFVVVPGAIPAVCFGRQAYVRWRRGEGPMLPVVITRWLRAHRSHLERGSSQRDRFRQENLT
ncbi:MAG: hypothetical protein ABI703_08625, partial [Gemmatimonadales bacterium]